MTTSSNNNTNNASAPSAKQQALLNRRLVKETVSVLTMESAIRTFASVLQRMPIAEAGGAFAASRKYSLVDYITKMVNTASLDVDTVVVAAIFMERFHALYPQCTSNEGGQHKLAFASLMVASKFTTDEPYSNASWVTISGKCLSLAEVNASEVEFLELLGYRLFVSDLEVRAYGSSSSASAKAVVDAPVFKSLDIVMEAAPSVMSGGDATTGSTGAGPGAGAGSAPAPASFVMRTGTPPASAAFTGFPTSTSSSSVSSMTS